MAVKVGATSVNSPFSIPSPSMGSGEGCGRETIRAERARSVSRAVCLQGDKRCH